MCRASLAVLLIARTATYSSAQGVVEKRLSAGGTRLEESFTNIVAVRELADGTVLVAEDPRDVRLVRADFRTNNITPVGAVGDGPNEYRGIHTLVPLNGDSTILVDWYRRQWIVLVGARPIAARSSAGAAKGDRIGRFLFGADSLGRLLEVRDYKYIKSRGPSRDNAESLVVLVHRRAPLSDRDRLTVAVDTLAKLRGSAGEQTRAVRDAVPGSPLTWVLNSPFAAEEQALMFPDAWIILLFAQPYSVQWISPTGTRSAVFRLPHNSVPVDERQIREAVARKWPRVKPPFRPAELPRLPRFLPAFGRNSLQALRDGKVMILRTYDATRGRTEYDIVDRRGQLVERLTMASNERVVGFGVRSVYVVARDEDHVETLSRYPWP